MNPNRPAPPPPPIRSNQRMAGVAVFFVIVLPTIMFVAALIAVASQHTSCGGCSP